jgi:hypothetical protein
MDKLLRGFFFVEEFRRLLGAPDLAASEPFSQIDPQAFRVLAAGNVPLTTAPANPTWKIHEEFSIPVAAQSEGAKPAPARYLRLVG